MWVLELFHHRNIVQLNVQVLIHTLQCPSNGDVVLELDRDLMIDQGLEKAEEQHGGGFRLSLVRRHEDCLEGG